jgi:hypothetical protein
VILSRSSKNCGGGGKGEGREEGGVMTQTLYPHMNKRNFKNIIKKKELGDKSSLDRDR